MLLVYFLGMQMSLFPLSNAYTISPDLSFAFISDVFYHAALPITALVLLNLSGFLLGMRNVMVNTLADEYVAMAEAKGLSETTVMVRYAARNAMLPQVTSLAIQIGFVVGGQLLIEYVFSYPGVGYQLINAVQARDFTLMQALFLLISAAVLLANFCADLLYLKLDPRARQI